MQDERRFRWRTRTVGAALLAVVVLAIGLAGYWGRSRQTQLPAYTTSTRTKTLSAEDRRNLARTIESNVELRLALERAKSLLTDGLNAGDIYPEVWIRDLNTFIELALTVQEARDIQKALLVFFHFQSQDGSIPDAYVAEGTPTDEYEHVATPTLPGFKAHKNTTATDQEASLVQAVHKYVRRTGDRLLLDQRIAGSSVRERLGRALEFVLKHRYSGKYGLVWGATTVDWGDVQPEHRRGINVDENSHRAIDVYDNAMLLIALNAYAELLGSDSRAHRWRTTARQIHARIRQHLWDTRLQKFRPHVYIAGSPFPDDFDEDRIYYHGGTAVAIEAGLLDHHEVGAALADMRNNVLFSGAPSIGLTVYPAYPRDWFKNSMMRPYQYQNGGDWTWFGGRMIQQLVAYGYIEEAYVEILPMVRRSNESGGFHEWYTLRNEPKGSTSYRGTAGVLGRAIEMLLDWARVEKNPTARRNPS